MKSLFMRDKRVYTVAYLQHNLGDDLFLYRMFTRYPDVNFLIVADEDYKHSLSTFENVKVINYAGKWAKIFSRARLFGIYLKVCINSCDYAVYIGGSIFMERTDEPNQYLSYRTLFDNKRLLFLGCNWGPCITDRFYQNMHNVFSQVKDVCFRDKYSYGMFRMLKSVRFAPDILYGFQFGNNVQLKQQVYISVIDCGSKGEGSKNLKLFDQNYIDLILRMVRESIHRGMRVVLVSYCKKENDHIAIDKICKQLSETEREYTDILLYDGYNWRAMIEELQASSLIIATRFHAAVLGLAAGKKVLPVVYSDKTKHVLEDVGFENPIVDLRNTDGEDVIKLFDAMDNWKEPVNLVEYKKRADEHFAVLDQLLKVYRFEK